jgi:chromate transporter
MNLLVLYLVLAKAMLTSFSGPTSLPVVHHDMVEKYHVISERELNAAVAAGRISPGPFGLYLVSVGYFVAGPAGAAVGFLALITPAFLIIPMLHYLGRRIDRPKVRSAIRCVTLAAAGLLVSTTVSLAQVTLQSGLSVAIAAGTFFFLVLTKRNTLWVVTGSALAGWAGMLIVSLIR